MFFETDLRFLCDVFNKCRLQTLILDVHSLLDARVDMGFRQMFGEHGAYNKTISEYFCNIEPNTVYRFMDALFCRYILLALPQPANNAVLCVGPYLSSELSHADVLEIAEDLKLDPNQARLLENHYGSIVCLPDSSRLFSVLETFVERIWGSSENYSVVDVNKERSVDGFHLQQKKDPSDPEIKAMNMNMMEARYSYENELMQAVAQGQSHKAGAILSSFSHLSFETRLPDALRNLKNYCIIMNTLLRKAAENGGVHPIYLDSISSSFAKKIEQLKSTSAVQGLMAEMFSSYCKLVKKHSMKHFSPPVQKAIIYIDSDLTANLSLSAIAKAQNVSASYLSWLFKQETGETLTDHVNKKRVKLAKKLLESTNLQIQTIAQYCGILDVQYFSKVFKKYVGKSPKEYRDSSKV